MPVCMRVIVGVLVGYVGWIFDAMCGVYGCQFCLPGI